MVVDDYLNHWNIVTDCSCDLIHIHSKATISCNIDNHFVFSSTLRSKSGA